MTNPQPFVPTHIQYPELTPKVIVLGFVMAALLAAANTYLGLKIGRTVSGSIPAAVLSIAILRQFKTRNILEHNLIQTAASAGECLAAGIIFTIPSLLMMGVWQDFHFFETFLIGLVGGGLGVLFSVPLRRVMIISENLPYPEGIAVAEVLKTSENLHGDPDDTHYLMKGSLIAALFVICQSGFKILSEGISTWSHKLGAITGFGFGFSPVLLAAGYIVGISVVVPILLGNMLIWQIGVPILSWLQPDMLQMDPAIAATTLYKETLRYVGIGVITFGGLWGLISLFRQIMQAIRTSYHALLEPSMQKLTRTEMDLPITWVLLMIVGLILPLFYIFYDHFQTIHLPITPSLLLLNAVMCTFLAIICGFIASAIASYLVGLIGTTSLPISGLSIAAISLISMLLMAALGLEVSLSTPEYAPLAASIAIIFAAIICLSASLGGDNMQDLKAGYVLGATPWKQQSILFLGVLAGSLVIVPVLDLLLNAYGIGDVLPRIGMDPDKALVAPQASMMRVVAEGFFLGKIKMGFFGVGLLIGCAIAIVDWLLIRAQKTFRLPVLAFGLGMYLPMNLVIPLFVGGLISFLLKRNPARFNEKNGILIAAGLIAGEALTGITLAIPFSFSAQGEEVLALPLHLSNTSATLLSAVAFLGMVYALCHAVRKK